MKFQISKQFMKEQVKKVKDHIQAFTLLSKVNGWCLQGNILIWITVSFKRTGRGTVYWYNIVYVVHKFHQCWPVQQHLEVYYNYIVGREAVNADPFFQAGWDYIVTPLFYKYTIRVTRVYTCVPKGGAANLKVGGGQCIGRWGVNALEGGGSSIKKTNI